MPVNTITTDVLMNHLKDTLRNPDNKICFILGAGASVESGIDSGGMLARQWYSELPDFHTAERILEWKAEKKFDEDNIPAFYSQLFKFRYEGHRSDGIDFISSVIEKGNPGFGYTILSQVLQRTPHNVVITTNFDTLTEESLFVFTNKRALVCNHENVAHLAKPGSTRPLIIKIHRGLYMDPMNDDDEIAVMQPQWEKALTNIFHNYIPIVIGYGGNDGSLMNYLDSIDPCKRMYWCLNSDRPPRADIEKLVARHGGSFVITGGFNRLMFRFIDLFGLTKIHEGMEQAAKERAEKLRNEFEEAAKDIGSKGSEEEKRELGKVADDFDTNDWLQWSLKAEAESNFERKEAIYREALGVLPQSHQLHYNLGWWLQEWNRNDEAIDAYDKAIKIKPDKEEAWFNMANSYHDKGDYDTAIAAYRKAIEIMPDDNETWYNMGNSYDKKGDYDNAIVAYGKAIEIKSNYDEAWYNMGISYRKKGDYDNAIASYRKAVEIKSDKHEAWNNMGYAYNLKKDYDNAIAAYLKAVEIKPDKHETWNNMGYAYSLKKDYDNAIAAYRKAVGIKPDKDEAWYNMGLSYEKKGDKVNAKECLKKASELKPDDPDYKKALDNL